MKAFLLVAAFGDDPRGEKTISDAEVLYRRHPDFGKAEAV